MATESSHYGPVRRKKSRTVSEIYQQWVLLLTVIKKFKGFGVLSLIVPGTCLLVESSTLFFALVLPWQESV